MEDLFLKNWHILIFNWGEKKNVLLYNSWTVSLETSWGLPFMLLVPSFSFATVNERTPLFQKFTWLLFSGIPS